MKLNYKYRSLVKIASLFLVMTGQSYALPFNIFPKAGTTLPTQISQNQTLTALYTVQNNTASYRANNIVRYLPPNVTQVTSDPTYPDLCGPLFNLAARGSAGDSCTLELKVTGPVNSKDPDPHHHLFVCFPGGKTCAGTLFPLNVTNLFLKQIAYIVNSDFLANSVSICPVNQNGSLGPCTAFLDPTIESPIDIVLNKANTFAYVANSNSDTISVCPVNPNGTLQPCTAAPAEGTNFTGLRLNPANNLLYYTNYTTNRVVSCPVGANGLLGACTPLPQVFQGPNGRIAFNAAGTIAYVSNFNNNTVSICAANPDGTFGACNPVSDPAFTTPLSAEVDPTGFYLYVPNFLNFSSTMAICPINPNGTLQTCTSNAGSNTFDFDSVNAVNLFIRNSGGVNYSYTPNGGSDPGTVSICTQSGGALGVCTSQTDPTFATPTGIWIGDFRQ